MSAGAPARAVAALAVALSMSVAACASGEVDGVETARLTRGDYTDVVEIRGDIRPVRTTPIMAPSYAGELVIVKLARSGTDVKAGDVVAEFDAVTMRRTIQEKESQLRSATAEKEQAEAQAGITLEERAAAVRKAQFDVERAKLALGATDLGGIEIVSAIEAEKARLAVADAEQRLREAEAAEAATRAGIESDRVARDRRIQQIELDLARVRQAVTDLSVAAPFDGTVQVMQNYRSATPMAAPPEYRTGDTTYPGAPIIELPDLSSVYLIARIEEADRGALRKGQTATIRADAVADRDYPAVVSDISLLARVDPMTGWPPSKLFDLTITIKDADGRLRPGMSAVARVDVGRLPDALIAPAEAVFTVDGQAVVYRLQRGAFEQVPVTVVRRGREQVAIEGDVADGDELALTRPDLEGAGAGAAGGGGA